MNWRETLPWNWGNKELPIKRESGGAGMPDARNNLYDLVDQLRNRPLGGAWPSLPALGEGFGFSEGSGFLPALDAKETDEEVCITVELPGLEEKDIEVTLREDLLTIRGEKRDESKHEEGDSQWVERRYGSFRRAIPLPTDADTEHVKAHFKAGILKVVVPRTGESGDRHRSIPIEVQ